MWYFSKTLDADLKPFVTFNEYKNNQGIKFLFCNINLFFWEKCIQCAVAQSMADY